MGLLCIGDLGVGSIFFALGTEGVGVCALHWGMWGWVYVLCIRDWGGCMDF